MPANAQYRFQPGDNVYCLLETRSGTEGYHEAIILDHVEDHYTKQEYYILAAHVRGPDDRPTWAIFDDVPQEKLGPERRDPAPRAAGVRRGRLCQYMTTRWWLWWTAADAVVLDHRPVTTCYGEARSLYQIARRSSWLSGWDITMDVDEAYVIFGTCSGGTHRCTG